MVFGQSRHHAERSDGKKQNENGANYIIVVYIGSDIKYGDYKAEFEFTWCMLRHPLCVCVSKVK